MEQAMEHLSLSDPDLRRADTSRWTSFPSLLQFLQPHEVDALENAICAFRCGRYQEAEKIFATQLPESHTLPVLALERADMYTTQGHEHKRMSLLKKTLEYLEDWDMGDYEVEDEQRLLNLMLGDSEIWIFGKLDPALSRARIGKSYLKSKSLEKISDIEIRTIMAYYQVMRISREQSNRVDEKNDGTLFVRSDGVAYTKPWMELSLVRQTLVAQGRLRAATRIALADIALQSDQTLMRLCESTIRICEELEQIDSAPSLFRAATVRLSIVSSLGDQLAQSSLDTHLEKVESLLKQITPPTYDNWQDFAPLQALQLNKLRAGGRSTSLKVAEYMCLAERSQKMGDHTSERQCRIAAIMCAEAAYKTQSTAECLKVLKEANSKFLEFEWSLQHGYFLAYALIRHSNQTAVSDRRWAKVKTEFEEFRTAFKEFELPYCKQQLTYYAMRAADENGDKKSKEHFRQEWIDASKNSPEKRYYQEIFSTDWVEQTKNAVRAMLDWADKDVADGVLDGDRRRKLFGTVSEPLKHLASDQESTGAKKNTDDIAIDLFGRLEPDPKPRSDKEWAATFELIKDWLFSETRGSEKERKHYLLKSLHACRRWLVREYLRLRSVDQEPTGADIQRVITLDEEHASILASITPAAVTPGDRARLQHDKILQALTSSFVNHAITAGICTDVLMQQALLEGENLARYFRDTENVPSEYAVWKSLGQIQLQRWLRFRSISPDACLGIFEKADDLYNNMRRERSILSPSAALVAKSNLSMIRDQEEIYLRAMTGARFALVVSFGGIAQLENLEAKNKYVQDVVVPNLNKLIDWAIRSKGRGLGDLLGFEARIPARMRAEAISNLPTAKLLEQEEHLLQQLKQAIPEVKPGLQKALQEKREEMRKEPLLKPILQLREGNLASEHTVMLDFMRSMGKDVVYVDWIDLQVGLHALIYKEGVPTMPQPINQKGTQPLMPFTMKIVEDWVKSHLSGKTPLNEINATAAILDELSPLVQILGQVTTPGQTLILCPTKTMHRIPLHALSCQGRPLIERNPIVYAQSLPVLSLCYDAVHDRNANEPIFRPVVLNPMPEYWPRDLKQPTEEPAPVLSNQVVQEVASELKAEFLHRDSIAKKAAQSLLADASFVHYHGHVSYHKDVPSDSTLESGKDQSPLDSALDLGWDRSKRAQVHLTAAEIFDLRLSKPAHVNLIGCASGRAHVSQTNDVLGLVPALHYAGASSVISTLWRIADEDGAGFSKLFFDALRQQRAGDERKSTATSVDDTTEASSGEGSTPRMMDLAKATQKTILDLKALKTPTGELRTPYNWAGFQLNGYWMYPSSGKTATF